MKTSPRSLTVFSLVALSLPLAGQVASPPNPPLNTFVDGATASTPAASTGDGVVVDRGQAYLMRNGRAARIDRNLIPDGQVLTWEGRLVPLPSGFRIYDTVAVQPDGIMMFGGSPYWMHQGRASLLNNTVVPQGKVLNAQGRLMALPTDFTGFIPDAAGAAQPISTELGTSPNPPPRPIQNGGAGVPAGGSPGAAPAGGVNTSPGAGGAGVLPAAGGTSATFPAGGGINGTDTVFIGGGGGTRAIGGVSPASGVHTFPGTSAANITNGATRPFVNGPPGSTAARTVGSGPRDNGTRAQLAGTPSTTTGVGSGVNTGGGVPAPSTAGAGTTMPGGTAANGATVNGTVTANGTVGPTTNGTAANATQTTASGATSGTTATTAGGVPATTAGGTTATTAGGTTATTGGGTTATTAGGVPATTAGGVPATTAGGAAATTAGGTPATTAGGVPATTAGGASATTAGGVPATTAGGVPATTSGGAPATSGGSSTGGSTGGTSSGGASGSGSGGGASGGSSGGGTSGGSSGGGTSGGSSGGGTSGGGGASGGAGAGGGS